MKHEEIDVIIPVYRPDEKLHRLLLALERQTVKPSRILLVNTERELFDDACLKGTEHVEVIHIQKSEFDHGGTRHMAAEMLQGAFLLFLTQDAIPADDCLIERLYEVFATGRESDRQQPVAAAYARQLPNAECSFVERYTRSFNYPEISCVKTKADLPRYGIKTYFCSNVCAAYKRSVYLELGGFTKKTIFNEDMIFAAKAMKNGYAVCYAADARVIHSHNYTAVEQFHRNFDLAISQADHPDVFSGIRSEGEGIRMVKDTVRWLVKTGHTYLVPKLVVDSGFKYLGYLSGKRYKKLPRKLAVKLSMNRKYWK